MLFISLLSQRIPDNWRFCVCMLCVRSESTIDWWEQHFFEEMQRLLLIFHVLCAHKLGCFVFFAHISSWHLRSCVRSKHYLRETKFKKKEKKTFSNWSIEFGSIRVGGYHTSWSSSGTLDSKSNTSLFGTECGRSKRRENLTQPHSNNNIRIGI